MANIVIISNIPSPYRVDMFYYMQTHLTEHEFHVIYTSKVEDNRSWSIAEEKLLNTHILGARIIKIKNKFDTRYIHLPGNIGKLLDTLSPDVVIAMEYNPAALQSLMWCRRKGKKFIHWTDGTLHSERKIGCLQKMARKLICKNADGYIASSTKSKEKLLAWGVDEKKIFVSLLTVDSKKFMSFERTPVTGRLLYVGSMISRKGLDLLIDALHYVKTDFELYIVGNGSDEQITNLKQSAQKKGFLERVVFCGYKEGDALVDIYKHAQVFILPTREDCFGLVLLEAAFMGIPIVSSQYADGAYDIVEDGENGFIIDPFDPKAFGEAIDRALNRETLKTNQRVHILEKFSFENVARNYLEAIEYVLR